MIRDVQRWQEFENAWIASHPADHAENLRIVDGMYQLARTFGHFTAEDALEGLENTIRLAAILHHRVRNTRGAGQSG
jgi:hypothetical protein